jgi:glyoxalase family protein
MIALRVPDQAAIDYWVARFDAHGIEHDAPYLWMGNRPSVAFRDPEGQQLMLISDLGNPGGIPWDKTDVPVAHAITGLFGTGITVRSRDQMELLYRDVFGFTFHHEMAHPTIPGRTLLFFSAGEIAGGTLIVQIAPDLPPSRLGAGGVHHIAFRVPDVDAAMFWIERLRSVGLQPTTVIDRFYFQSVYTRVPGNILIEIATDGPGFAQDESLETMGQRLSLPPFLEGRRRQIEAGLKPLA